MRWVCELFADVHTATTEKFKEGNAAPVGGNVWHLDKLDSLQALSGGALNFIPEKGLKVVQVSELTRLADTLTARKPLMPVKPQAIVHIVKVAHEKEQGANGRARSPLPRVAVHYQHILRVSYIHTHTHTVTKTVNIKPKRTAYL